MRRSSFCSNLRRSPARPVAARALATEQQAFRRELAAQLPDARIGWRYRLVANGFSLSLPSEQLPRLRALPGVRDVLPAGELRAAADVVAAADRRASPLGLDPRHRRSGDEDRDHRLGRSTPGTASSIRPGTRCRPASRRVSSASRPRRSSSRACSRRRARRQRAHAWRSARATRVTARTSRASRPGTPRRRRGSGRVSGVAPRAYLGNYKVFVETDSGLSPNANSPAIVAAIEAAVADGMDVINFSGGEPEIEPSRDIVALALDAAAAAGVVPVVAAGNDYNDLGAGLRLVARQLVPRHQRRRSRHQRYSNDEDACRVLVRRADDDLAASEARRRGARCRRPVVGPGRRLGGVLRDEHGSATHRRRGGAPGPAAPGMDGGAAEVRARAVRRRRGRRAGSSLPGRASRAAASWR